MEGKWAEMKRSLKKEQRTWWGVTGELFLENYDHDVMSTFCFSAKYYSDSSGLMRNH